MWYFTINGPYKIGDRIICINKEDPFFMNTGTVMCIWDGKDISAIKAKMDNPIYVKETAIEMGVFMNNTIRRIR